MQGTKFVDICLVQSASRSLKSTNRAIQVERIFNQSCTEIMHLCFIKVRLLYEETQHTYFSSIPNTLDFISHISI